MELRAAALDGSLKRSGGKPSSAVAMIRLVAGELSADGVRLSLPGKKCFNYFCNGFNGYTG